MRLRLTSEVIGRTTYEAPGAALEPRRLPCSLGPDDALEPRAGGTLAGVRVFVAGGTGVIGRGLIPMLVAYGHDVTATTRSPDRVAVIESLGARAAVVDAMDGESVMDAVVRSAANVVVHQLTDLGGSRGTYPDDATLERNARLRIEGTANVVAAAVEAGAQRLVAQSIAWLYAPGREPYDEADPLVPLDADGGPPTVRGVHELERQVTTDSRFQGVVLRYGRLYGPGTWDPAPPEPPTVHVEAAAVAALLAVDRGAPGVYNVVDDGDVVSNAKARAELGWEPTGPQGND